MANNQPLSDADLARISGGLGSDQANANTGATNQPKPGSSSGGSTALKPGDELLNEADLIKVAAGGAAVSKRSFAVDQPKTPSKGGTRGSAEPSV